MEEWKTVKGFEDYQVSNLGRLKSFKRVKERILKNSVDSCGYYNVNIYNSAGVSNKQVHQLVAIAFLGHIPCGLNLVINHKDFDKLNNHVDNLEIVTQRENANKKHVKSSSEYVGVCWHKRANKWVSRIVINGKRRHLGYFTNELEASQAYGKALETIKQN